MSFQFAREKLLHIEKLKQSHCEWELGQAVRNRERQRRQLEHIRSLEAQAEQQLAEQLTQETLTGFELYIWNHYISQLRYRAEQKEQHLQRMAQEVAQKREALARQTIEVKKWSRLRERAYQQHTQRQLRYEQMTLDEVAIQQYRMPD